MALVHIKPNPAPKQLTARSTNSKLLDHYLAFACVNRHDLAEDAAGPLMVLFAEIEAFRGITLAGFKRYAKKIRKLTERDIKHSVALEYISRMYGYENWHEAHIYGLLNDNKVTNRNWQDPLGA